MQYSYKLSGYRDPVTLKIEKDQIVVLDEQSNQKRVIPLRSVRSLYEYDGLIAVDPELGGFRSYYCSIRTTIGRSLTIRNGSYLKPAGKIGDYATNQHESYLVFIGQLKTGLASENPNLPVKTGSKIVVVVCFTVFLAGVFLLSVPLVSDVTTDNESIAMIAFLIVFFILFGGTLCWWGLRNVIKYLPKSRPITADL